MKQTQRKAKPTKAKAKQAKLQPLQQGNVSTTVTPATMALEAVELARYLSDAVENYRKTVNSEDQLRPPYPKIVQNRLFEVRFNPELLKNTRIFTWLYERKRLVNRIGSGLCIAYFEDKTEGKMFRDVLNDEVKDMHHHMSYGPDHRRVIGEVA